MPRSISKRKSAQILNPRAATEWSKDDSKFGQRMLEKMGWKKGQGLGLSNQGVTENIRVRFKLDNKGLGFKIDDNQWVETEHKFAEVLSQLRQNTDSDGDIEMNNGVENSSLESESVPSKTRIRYSKFHRGKDVNRYKNDDLLGILGQSIKKKKKNNAEVQRDVCSNATCNNEDNSDDTIHRKSLFVNAKTEENLTDRADLEGPSNSHSQIVVSDADTDQVIDEPGKNPININAKGTRVPKNLEHVKPCHKFVGSNLTIINGYGNNYSATKETIHPTDKSNNCIK